MTSGLREDIRQIKEIVRELYVFSTQLEALDNMASDSKMIMNKSEKELLESTIISLTNQLKILNNAVPNLLNMASFYKGLPNQQGASPQAAAPTQALSKVTYKPAPDQQEVSLVISDSDKKDFLDNLSKSRLSINMLKKKYATETPVGGGIQRASFYAKISNTFFRNFSNKLIVKGRFGNLNKSLRKINSRFVVGSYVSMVFFTSFLAFIFGLFLFILLLFGNITLLVPFFVPVEFSLLRLLKVIWVIPLVPITAGFLFYIYPFTEAKNLGSKIDQELPFVTIHMSAIASSGVEPTSIFKILLRGGEYKYTSIEIKKLMNLINFHGADIVSALKKISVSSSSLKLKELLNGLAVSITSGGDLHNFLSKHSETMLFDYKLEREKYNKISETFMDIYISIAIAAPMIMLMIFVIIGSTGLMGNLFGLSTNALSILMIMGIVLLNIFFLIFLRLKQPTM
jgi:hypothetical protein